MPGTLTVGTLTVAMMIAAALSTGCRSASTADDGSGNLALPQSVMEPDEAIPVLPPVPGEADTSEHAAPSGSAIYEDEVELEALFVIDPVAGSKRLQPESLVLDTGERWIVAYRPIRSHFPYADRRVFVRGRPFRFPADFQSVNATHFELLSIELAPGETPYQPPPSELPAPPQVRTGPELQARLGRGLWVHCVGVLLGLRPSDEEESRWLEGTFLLEDGTEVPLRKIPRSQRRFATLSGKKSTILAQILDGSQESEIQLAPDTICPGAVDRCQMTLDNVRDL